MALTITIHYSVKTPIRYECQHPIPWRIMVIAHDDDATSSWPPAPPAWVTHLPGCTPWWGALLHLSPGPGTPWVLASRPTQGTWRVSTEVSSRGRLGQWGPTNNQIQYKSSGHRLLRFTRRRVCCDPTEDKKEKKRLCTKINLLSVTKHSQESWDVLRVALGERVTVREQDTAPVTRSVSCGHREGTWSLLYQI